jgi:hypothetical protein
MGDDNFQNIKSIQDEYKYWQSISENFKLANEVTDRAAAFAERLAPLSSSELFSINSIYIQYSG